MTDPAPTPTLLLSLPHGTHPGSGDPVELVELAVRAEAAGIDGVIIADHVLIGTRTDRYEWGTFPFPPEAPWLEALTVLAAMAARTERLLLTTGILVVPLRPAAFLAKQVATIDRLSGGRLSLGVGTGWQHEEFTAGGLDPDKRGRYLTDYVAACRALWTDAPASFASETVSFDTVWSEPRPTRPGGPAVLFSGTLTPRNVRRIVELGDGWIPIMGATLDDVREGVARLRTAYEAAGREPSSLVVRVPLPAVKGDDGRPDPEATVRGGLLRALAAGATEVSVQTGAFTKDYRDAAFDDALRSLAAAFAGEVAAL